MSGPGRASVVIVTRDRPEHLERLLASLEAQTVAPHEVIVVDNASTRSYAGVRARFDGRLPLRWVAEPRPGIPGARNRGLAEATGEFVLFTDDDCVAEPGWLEALVRPFARNPHIGAVGGEILSARRAGSLAEEFCIDESLLTMGRPEGDEDARGAGGSIPPADSPGARGRLADPAAERA